MTPIDRDTRDRDEVPAAHGSTAALTVPFRGGKGEPLVLLHGLETTAEQWRPAGVALAKRNQVAILDLLGFGASHASLTSRFTLEDHAAAVWATVRQLFGERPVRFVGHGLGAAVALACAAARPEAVTEVIAFSPTLEPPAGVDTEAVAELRASLAALRADGGRRLRQAVGAEALAERVIPRARSLADALATNAPELLDSITAPVVVVAPDDDALTPKTWLRGYAASHPDRVSVVDTEGGRLLPFENPAAAAKLVEPGSEEVLKAARREQPIEARKPRAFDDAFEGENSLLFRRGALLLLGGMALLLVPGLSGRLVLLGLAIGLLVEALMTVAGSFGLRRSGRRWLGWLLVGLVSTAFALYITMQYALSAPVTALSIAAWLLTRGMADGVVAWQTQRAAVWRWLLGGQALLGLGLGVAVAVAPALGGALLSDTLGAYLAIAGVLTVAYAWAARREIVTQLNEAIRG